MFYLNRKIDFEKRRRVGGGMGVVVVGGAKKQEEGYKAFYFQNRPCD